jgi:hypothetical protein
MYRSHDATDLSQRAARIVHHRLFVHPPSRPDLRVRAMTDPSPRTVYRHVDIHGPPPRDPLDPSTIRVRQRNVNHKRSQS